MFAVSHLEARSKRTLLAMVAAALLIGFSSQVVAMDGDSDDSNEPESQPTYAAGEGSHCEREIFGSLFRASESAAAAVAWEWPVQDQGYELDIILSGIDAAADRHRIQNGALETSPVGYFRFASQQLQRTLSGGAHGMDLLAGNGVHIGRFPLSNQPRSWLNIRVRKSGGQLYFSLSGTQGLSSSLLSDLSRNVFQSPPVGQRLRRTLWVRSEPDISAVAEVIGSIVHTAKSHWGFSKLVGSTTGNPLDNRAVPGDVARSADLPSPGGFFLDEHRRLRAGAETLLGHLSERSLIPPVHDGGSLQPMLDFDAVVLDSQQWRIRVSGAWEYTLAQPSGGSTRIVKAWLSASHPITLEIEPKDEGSHPEVMELLSKLQFPSSDRESHSEPRHDPPSI